MSSHRLRKILSVANKTESNLRSSDLGSSLRSADAFPVVASLPLKNTKGEKRRLEMRLRFAGYLGSYLINSIVKCWNRGF